MLTMSAPIHENQKLMKYVHLTTRCGQSQVSLIRTELVCARYQPGPLGKAEH